MPKNSSLKRRLQFSLLNLMFAMTIAALGVGWFVSARRNRDLHAVNEGLANENLRHRNELGIFDVTDPAQVHAVRVPTEDGKPLKYRVYLPQGKEYTIHHAVNGIPEKGVPSGQGSGRTLVPGNYLISIKLTRDIDRKTGEPIPLGTVYLDVNMTDGPPDRTHGTWIGISESKNDWLLNKETGNTAYTWETISRQLRTFREAEMVVLYRARASTLTILGRRSDGKPSSVRSTLTAGDCDGFMVWIEPKPVKETE